MPDGHILELKGGMTFDEAVNGMSTDGAASLAKADEQWRQTHNGEVRGASRPAGEASLWNGGFDPSHQRRGKRK